MKRITALFLAAVLMLMCGCSAFLEKEYLSISDYDASADHSQEKEFGTISSYSALMDTLENMVRRHQGSAQLQFNNYVGSISDDLAEASWQLKQNDAISAYMVDYISYDISRIVTYYQATVYINYTRTAEEMDNIRIIGADRISANVVEAVSKGDERLVIQVYTSTSDSGEMARRIENAIVEAPDKVTIMPEISVDIYSGQDSHDIFDISFDYGGADVSQLQPQFQEALVQAADRISQQEEYSIAVLAAGVVGDLCSYDPEVEGTAYDALVLGRGGSRAVSMAYSAICAQKGLDTRVVSGLKNNEEHYWSLVKIGDHWYHADVAEAMNMAPDAMFLRTDSEMVKSFRWDELDYPACDGISLIQAAEKRAQTVE